MTSEKKELSKFEELLKINLKDKVEKKASGGKALTYLSWSFAIAEMEKAYPEWEYNILEFNGLPYQFDPITGYMVWTEIKAGGKTKKMWLPVMDGANKAMKDKSYEYTTKFGKKTCEAATMFDINKTIMRCLVKNIAMFGIGLYIYNGEDLPEGESEDSNAKNKPSVNRTLANIADDDMKEMMDNKNQKDFENLKTAIENCPDEEALKEVWTQKENIKIINSLKKWQPKLHDILIESKDFMKASFVETKKEGK